MKHAFSETFEEILQNTNKIRHETEQLIEINKLLAKENEELKSILKKMTVCDVYAVRNSHKFLKR